MNGRDNGYYWVKFIGLGWVVCNWNGSSWLIPGIVADNVDINDILEIDERRIVREESKLDQCVKMLKELTYDPRFPEGGIDLNHCCRDGH